MIPWNRDKQRQQRHFDSLTAHLSCNQITRHFEFDPRMPTVTDEWALVFPGKTSLYSVPLSFLRYASVVLLLCSSVLNRLVYPRPIRCPGTFQKNNKNTGKDNRKNF